MNNFFKHLTSLVLRLGLLLVALVFLASLVFAAGLVLVFWLVRGLWAKLTGQPVQPWVFKMHRPIYGNGLIGPQRLAVAAAKRRWM